MTTASKEAYAAIVDKLPNKRGAVFGVIACAHNGKTIRETCAKLNWPYSTVSARIFELAESGLIREAGEREGQTIWTPTPQDEVDAMRAARAAVKKYEARVVRFEGVGGPTAYGPDQTMRVTVEIPRSVWSKLKSPVRVRFL